MPSKDWSIGSSHAPGKGSGEAAFVISALASLAIPVALAWWLVKKQKARLTTIVIGAGVFIVFALLLEPVLHQLVLKGPKGSVILGNVWLFPVAIFLHFLVDACAVVISKSASMAFTEIVIFAMALAVGAIGFLLARKLNQDTEPAAVSSRP